MVGDFHRRATRLRASLTIEVLLTAHVITALRRYRLLLVCIQASMILGRSVGSSYNGRLPTGNELRYSECSALRRFFRSNVYNVALVLREEPWRSYVGIDADIN